MPSRELISLNGKERYGFNVSDTVGLGGMNTTGDVLVVQAMLNYIAEGGLGLQCFGYIESLELGALPELTGTMDHETTKALAMFASLNRPRLYGGSDLMIHPASYAGRDLNRFKPIMKITLLHVYAVAAAKRQGDSDYTTAMLRMLPRLIPFVVNKALTPPNGRIMGGLNALARGGMGDIVRGLGGAGTRGMLGRLAGSGKKLGG